MKQEIYNLVQKQRKTSVSADLNSYMICTRTRRMSDQRLPARRTRRVQNQPSIYTLDMKAMVAPRKKPNIFPFHELSETNRTVRGRDMQHRLVNHHRDPAQRLLLDTGGGQPRGRLVWSLAAAAATTIGGAALQKATHDRV